MPEIDLEAAILSPQNEFGDPERVIDAPNISSGLRYRILKIWELDLKAQMTSENEGGVIRSSTADMLKRVTRALVDLEKAASLEQPVRLSGS